MVNFIGELMMATTNPITGDSIASRLGSKEQQEKFENNFDAIFGKKPKKEKYIPPPLYSEDFQSEQRDTAIAQNGNDGDHYDKV